MALFRRIVLPALVRLAQEPAKARDVIDGRSPAAIVDARQSGGGRFPMVFSCTIPAHPTVQVDDDRVRITRWDFEPGAATGWHEHAMPYCIVMILGGTLVVHDGEKDTRVPLGAGDAYARPKGITHDVMNGSDHPIAFVEIEMKR